MNLPVLKYGDVSEHVKTLQSILRSRGYFDGTSTGNFLTKTKAAVVQFQLHHVGSNGLYLKADGVVGPATWWALQSSQEQQKSSLPKPGVPSKLHPDRQKVLELCMAEYKKGVKEVPDGSNWGDGVSKYLEGVGANPWCAFLVSWIWKNALGKYPMGVREGHCLTLWNRAKEKGFAKLKADYSPVPGDIFLMLYRNDSGRLTGMGHTGIVSSVSADGKSFNTFAGNESNRLKHGQRQVSQSTLVGFIRLLPQEGDFTRKLYTTEQLSDSLSSTR